MNTTLVLFGLFLALAQCLICTLEKPGKEHLHEHNCKPTDACIENGGYCIRNSKKKDCDGLVFPMECRSALCSCCVEVTLKQDECAKGVDTCPANSECQDKEIGYECTCAAGFEQCGDINECDSNPCGPNSQCQNTYGSYDCVCNAGCEKVVNGSCVDINECDSNPCGSNGVCSNSVGSFSCSCTAGYEFSEGSCVEINECLSNPCENGSVCTNTPGSYLCQCLPGYSSIGGGCVDVDDCASSPCSKHSSCTDKLGGYDCACYACAEQCQYGATFVQEAGKCMKLIHGNMTLSEADVRCSEDFDFLAIIVRDFDLGVIATFFLINLTDLAWVKRSASYSGAFNGECLGVKASAGESVDCDSELEYAVCIAKRFY